MVELLQDLGSWTSSLHLEDHSDTIVSGVGARSNRGVEILLSSGETEVPP